MKKILLTIITFLFLAFQVQAFPPTGKVKTINGMTGGAITGDISFNRVEAPITASGVLTLTDAATGGTLKDNIKYCYSVTYYTATGETDTINATSYATAEPVKCTTGAALDCTTGGGGADTHKITISGLPTSSDSRVIGRRIYRGAEGCAYPYQVYLIKTITDNTTTSYIDTGDALGSIVTEHNTTGGRIFSGDGSTPLMETSSELTSVGIDAGLNNHGYDNTYFGFRAGKGTGNTSYGKANNAFGNGALGGITTGNSNTAIGSGSGKAVSTGTANVFIGSHAGDGTTTGNSNVGIGFGALYSLTGNSNNNVAIGDSAGLGVTTGTGNVFIGYQVGNSITSSTAKLMIDNYDTSTPLIGGDFTQTMVNLSGGLSRGWSVASKTAGNKTITWNNIQGGLIVHAATGAPDSLTLPTAASFTAGIPFCYGSSPNGSGIEFLVKNTGAGSSILTMNGDGKEAMYTGDTATIATLTTARFLAVVVDCSSTATPSVVIYRIGTTSN